MVAVVAQIQDPLFTNDLKAYKIMPYVLVGDTQRFRQYLGAYIVRAPTRLRALQLFVSSARIRYDGVEIKYIGGGENGAGEN